MKKVIISSIFTLALIATTGYGVNRSLNSDANLSGLALNNVEALAAGETICQADPVKNTGVCKRKVDGNGDSCVTPGIFDFRNCIRDVVI